MSSTGCEGLFGMRIVPFSHSGWQSYGSKDFKEKFITFVFIIVGDIVIFVVTILCMLWMTKDRSRRLVHVSNRRISRPGKRKPDRRICRTFLLWLLYWQGSHPELSHFGLQVASAAPIPDAGHDGENTVAGAYAQDVLFLMSMSGVGTDQEGHGYGPGQNLLNNPEAVVQENEVEDAVLEETSDDDASLASPWSNEEEMECNGPDNHHDGQEPNPGGDGSGGPEGDQEVRDVDADDWNNVFQFRRHYSMRHCFVRWTSYRNIVSGIANTWDVSQDDVYAVHDMAVHPPGIVETAQPVIVQLWGDDLPHEVGMSVLVDLELFLPASYHESHMRERHVKKFPELVTRMQILQIANAAGICEIRNHRCLVRHNLVSVPLQSLEARSVKNCDYFRIQVPPLEDCLPEENSMRISLLQRSFRIKTQRRLATLGKQALGNVEDATRDLHTGDGLYKDGIDQLLFLENAFYNESERSSTQPDVTCAAIFPLGQRCKEERSRWIPRGLVHRDPMEGLPDPGNPPGEAQSEQHFFHIGSSDEEEVIDKTEQEDAQVRLKVDIGEKWTELLKLFVKWDMQPTVDLPECSEPTGLALQFLSACEVGIQKAKEIWIYTDGSFSRQRDISTFAVAIFGFNSQNPVPHSFGGWFGGIVELDKQNARFLGAISHSAVEAEVSGLIWAHAWLLQSGFQGDVSFCFDSQMAGYGASGAWNGHSCAQLGRLRDIAQLYRQVRRVANINYEHVKAHSGQPANELVDALTRACQECVNAAHSPFLPQTDWRPLFCQDSNILEWAWWIILGISGDQAVPTFTGDAFVWNYGSAPKQADDIRPIECHLDKQEILPKKVHFSLQVATFNVLSLNRRTMDGENVEACRSAMLRSQLEASGYHIIGLQETRANGSTMLVAEDYVRIVSGSHDNSGHYGCEIWLARRIPFGQMEDEAIYCDHKKVTVLVSDPRLLAIRIQLRGCSLIVVSCHAPHEAATTDNKDKWWHALQTTLCQFSRQGRVIVLGDFHARVGRREEPAIGELLDHKTNDNGERLIALCIDHSLWIPSTYEHLHAGQPHTWVHPKGTKARLDYVLMENEFEQCVQWSSCDPNIQVANSAIDHTLLGAGISWTEHSQVHTRKSTRRYDWEAMHTTAGRQTLQDIVRSLPDVSWNVDTHQHWQILEDKLHQGLQEHFPVKRRPPRAELFTDQTWDALRKRKQIKAALEEWDGYWEGQSKACGFKAWKDGTPLMAARQLYLFEQYALLLLRHFLLQNFRSASRKVRNSAADDKAAFINNIGTTAATQNNTDIFATLKRLRVGAAFRKKALTPLPLLKGSDSVTLQSWEGRDDCWREHCAKMEAGVQTTTASLVQAARQSSFKRLQLHPEQSLQGIPSLRDLEGAFRRIRPRKTPGVDNLRSDICSLAAADLAWKYHPLLMKVATTYSEPIQMKGGVLIAAYKSGPTGEVDSYRSLLLSSHIGKALRRTFRPKLVELYSEWRPHCMCR